MSLRVDDWRRYAPRAVAILVVLVIYDFARIPVLTHAERSRMAADFSFSRAPLPELAGTPQRTVREVNPSLRHIKGWISAVGAAVALNDLNGDGLPNDVCYVDTRSDKVIVAPVPGAPQSYQPFALDPLTLPFDAKTMAPMGCLPGDFDENGLTDVLVYYWGRSPVVFLQQKTAGLKQQPLGSNSYTRSELAGGGERWYTNAATLTDLDGDGHTDIIIGNYYQDGARILDANADNKEQMQDSMSLAFNGGRNRLLLWKKPSPGAPSPICFEDVQGVMDEPTTRAWTLAVGAADLNGDLLPEIYFANDFGPDRLLYNRSQPGKLRFELLEGTRTLLTPKSKVLGRDSYKGMGVDFGDVNGDGWLDIYVSNIAEAYALEESHFVFISTGQIDLMERGIAPYVDQSESLGLSRSGWAWDVRFGDFNNDGILEALQATGFLKGAVNRWADLHELAMGNDTQLKDPRSWPRFQPGDDLSGEDHSRFFVRAADGRYHDMALEMGLDQIHVSRGIATADTDGDGQLDFAIANQWSTSFFFHNDSRNSGEFVGLRLRLPVNADAQAETRVSLDGKRRQPDMRPAIGAQAKVFLDGGQTLVAQVDGGSGHSGKRSPDLHFGLGNVPQDRKLTIELRWRDTLGQPHRQTLQLLPGKWYTVLLGLKEGVINESE